MMAVAMAPRYDDSQFLRERGGEVMDQDFQVVIVLVFVVILIVAAFFRRAVRRLFIGTAEFLVLLITLVFIAFCGALGTVAMSFGRQYGLPANISPMTGFVVGAGAGFLISVIFSAIFFLLVEIADNTRKTLEHFEQLNSRGLPGDR
jgi:hypothetical protein